MWKRAQQFGHWYNEVHLPSGLNFVTPMQCHSGVHAVCTSKRKELYEGAKAKHPERWARKTGNWTPHEQVALNSRRDEGRKKALVKA